MYRSILSSLNTNQIIGMLLTAIPKKDTGFGYSISRLSANGEIHDVIPASTFSISEFNDSIRNVIFDNIQSHTTPQYGLMKKKQYSKKISDINTEITNYALLEQQKEMSLDFFETLAGNSEKKTPPTLSLNNFKIVKSTIESITETLLIISNQDNAIKLIQCCYSEPYQNNSEEKILETIESNPKRKAYNGMLFDACLLFNLLESDEWRDKASRLLEPWLMQSLYSVGPFDTSDSIECLSQDISIKGCIVATAALLLSKSHLEGFGRKRLVAVIRSQISKDNIFPYFYDENLEKINAWLHYKII
jgi:hypothetical protein